MAASNLSHDLTLCPIQLYIEISGTNCIQLSKKFTDNSLQFLLLGVASGVSDILLWVRACILTKLLDPKVNKKRRRQDELNVTSKSFVMFLNRIPYSKSSKLFFNQFYKLANNKPIEKFVNHSRLYHLITRNYARDTSKLKTPELVYFPQVMRWLKTKIGFKVLQKTWDPQFSEGAFIYGSTHAICRITEVISNGDRDNELRTLVTPRLRRKLIDNIISHMTETQKKIIVLTPDDIKLLIPIEVRLKQEEEKRNCIVALRTLAVKWQDINGVLRLVIIAIQTEFIRDYSDILSDAGWTIRLFDILECGIVGDARPPLPRK